jgi:Ca-activated chloride channel family protein
MPPREVRLRNRFLIALLLFPGLAFAIGGQLPAIRTIAPPPPDLNLIVNYITVTASKGSVPRLTSGDFEILEDNKLQKIDYFAVQDQPATVGILWGGGVATDADPDVRECPKVFMKNMVPGSEYFVLSSDTVTTSFNTDIERIPKMFPYSGVNPDTTYIGLDVLKESANSRKILFVVTNPSGGSGGQLDRYYVERAAIRQGYQVHVVAFDPGGAPVSHEGWIFLNELSELTGGSFTLSVPTSVICGEIARELRVQYMIGYHPTNAEKDGKWRKLGVKLKSSLDGLKLKARIKRGYYAAKDSR